MDYNYRNMSLRELKAFSDTHKDYSIGTVLYSILRMDEEGFSKRVKDLKEITDEDFYEMICKAKIEESEDAD